MINGKYKYKTIVRERKVTRLPSGKRNLTFETEIVRLAIDIDNQSLSDIHTLIANIVVDETDKQIRINNPPTRFEVNRREGRPDGKPIRNVQVLYGTELASRLMSVVEIELAKHIRLMTTKNHPLRVARWQWFYLPFKGRKKAVEPHTIKSFGFMDQLVLVPQTHLAGMADFEAANYGQARWKGDKRRATAKGNKQGFVGRTAQRLKRKNIFANFSLYGTFTQKYAYSGERYKHGSPILIIVAKRIGYSPTTGRIKNLMSEVNKIRKKSGGTP